MFTALIATTPANVDLLGTIAGGQVNENFSEFVITQSEATGQSAHLIYFTSGRDGVWRIEAM